MLAAASGAASNPASEAAGTSLARSKAATGCRGTSSPPSAIQLSSAIKIDFCKADDKKTLKAWSGDIGVQADEAVGGAADAGARVAATEPEDPGTRGSPKQKHARVLHAVLPARHDSFGPSSTSFTSFSADIMASASTKGKQLPAKLANAGGVHAYYSTGEERAPSPHLSTHYFCRPCRHWTH